LSGTLAQLRLKRLDDSIVPKKVDVLSQLRIFFDILHEESHVFFQLSSVVVAALSPLLSLSIVDVVFVDSFLVQLLQLPNSVSLSLANFRVGLSHQDDVREVVL